MDKLILQHFSQYKSVEGAEKLQTYGVKMTEQFVGSSHAAAATMCALIMPRLSNHYGSKEQLLKFWNMITGFSLLPKTLWNIYIEDLLTNK